MEKGFLQAISKDRFPLMGVSLKSLKWDSSSLSSGEEVPCFSQSRCKRARAAGQPLPVLCDGKRAAPDTAASFLLSSWPGLAVRSLEAACSRSGFSLGWPDAAVLLLNVEGSKVVEGARLWAC